jgi:hypothetical protein
MLGPSIFRGVPRALSAAFLLLAACSREAPEPVAPSVQEIADGISESRYREYHLAMENMGLGLYGGEAYDMGFRNRDALEGQDSPGNQEARLYLRDTFSAMGLEVTLQGEHQNVVGELTGATTPEEIYVIGAHYDHLEGDMPGGDDNASGVAGILEAARVMSQFRFEATIRFIGFNAEEDGLAGSRDYVENKVIPAGETVVGMVNLDMILRPGSDVEPENVIDAEVEAKYDHPPSVAWARAFQSAAAEFVPALIVNDTIIDTESSSDNDPFREAGIPGILVIENSLPDFWDANSAYHTREDASDRLANDPENPTGVTYDYAFATEVTRAVVAFIAREARPAPVGERGEG